MTIIFKEHSINRHKISKLFFSFIYLFLIQNTACSSRVEKGKTWVHPKLDLSMVFISNTNSKAGVNSFWLGETEVTQELWKEIMGEEELHPEKPSPFWGLHPKMPKVSVSYYDVEQFIERLNLKTGILFRLPSAEEWELACAAGKTTDFHYGRTLSWDKANFNSTYKTPLAINGPSAKRPVPVASYDPNAFGIYDMHGNAYEWTSSKDLSIPDQTLQTHDHFIIKGGSWAFGADRAVITKNISHGASLWGHSIGFRLAADSIDLQNKVSSKK